MHNGRVHDVTYCYNLGNFDTSINPKTLWEYLTSDCPIRGGIFLSFYYWLQNTHLTQEERDECLEWLKTGQWDKVPRLIEVLHIYNVWKTQKNSTT